MVALKHSLLKTTEWNSLKIRLRIQLFDCKITQPHQSSNVKVRTLTGKKWDLDLWDGTSGPIEPKLRILNPLSLPFQWKQPPSWC